ncbi:MAG: phosphopyruvate hydratase [Myxococcota bacterium]
MSQIERIHAREILDSRGNPTIEVDVVLDSGALGRAAVPSGASTGSREAVELRDGGERFRGKGVRRAVEHVNGEIARTLVGAEIGGIDHQSVIDRTLIDLDGEPTKSRLGANAILGVSLGSARAAARDAGVPFWEWLLQGREPLLPLPGMNVLNGGRHASNSVDFQEYMILPVGAPCFAEALRFGAETFQALRDVLIEGGYAVSVGDEGGFAPDLSSNREAVELVLRGIERAGYRPGEDVAIALDVAASELWREGGYSLEGEGARYSSDEMIRLYESWLDRYPIQSLEDGLAEEDWDGWQALTTALGGRVQLVGDDIFVTDPAILSRGIEQGVANAILIKLNQIGTLTETLETCRLAEQAGYGRVISHRSGETEDTSIADFAVGTAAAQIKSGSLCRSERVSKYNQLLRIEESLGARARWAGRTPLTPGG